MVAGCKDADSVSEQLPGVGRGYPDPARGVLAVGHDEVIRAVLQEADHAPAPGSAHDVSQQEYPHLARGFRGPDLADDGDLDLPGVLDLGLDALRDQPGEIRRA